MSDSVLRQWNCSCERQKKSTEDKPHGKTDSASTGIVTNTVKLTCKVAFSWHCAWLRFEIHLDQLCISVTHSKIEGLQVAVRQVKFSGFASARKLVSIKKYCGTSLSKDWEGTKWGSILKLWEQLQDKHSKVMQILLTVEKIEGENLDFVFLILSFFYLFPRS